MKRSVLFVGNESPLNEEIQDFVLDHEGHAFFSITSEQSIRVLDAQPIDLVILTLHKLEDAALLKYINNYHPNIQVLISTHRENEDLIGIFSRGRYSMVKYPLKLEELNSFI